MLHLSYQMLDNDSWTLYPGLAAVSEETIMKESVKLNQRNLHLLPKEIARPATNRSQLTPGIVHVGVGGFHRSHQAFYTDDLISATGVTNWGICGVGLREADRKIAHVLKSQDYLYTLIVKHPDGKIENRVIGSLIDFMLGCDDPAAVIDKMASAQTKIVSLTITEGGYNFNPATGEFDFNHPDVIHDLANPSSPKMVFGYLTAALKKRRAAGLQPFTIQSCDNIQHNGDITRKMLLAFADKQDADLAQWIEREVCFPNAMVDRITPVTTPPIWTIWKTPSACRMRGRSPVSLSSNGSSKTHSLMEGPCGRGSVFSLSPM